MHNMHVCVHELHVGVWYTYMHTCRENLAGVAVQIFEEVKNLNKGKCSISENNNCSTRTTRYKIP